MVIECSSCHARFKLADEKIKENGTKVRCTKCREVFTVFPESSSPITPPVVAVSPVVSKTNEVVDTSAFSLSDKSPCAGENPSATITSPVNEDDDWKQGAESTDFSDGFTDNAGASDLDAITFDNIEAPVFSVTTEKNSKFEFADDTAFSFSDDSPFTDAAEEPYKIAGPTNDQALSAVRDRKDLGLSPDTTADEFSFSASDNNLSDFSWEEPEVTPEKPVTSEKMPESLAAPQDTAFDFSSFSFDEVSAPVGSDERESAETVAQYETTIELSRETETSPSPVLTNPLSMETPTSSPPPPVAHERHESNPPTAKSIRPRSRQKRKGATRLAFKVIFAIILAVALIYGIMNRDLIQREYKNIVSTFIEKQVPVETSGRIGLVKLSGGYIPNSREGDLFVIHGEAVNEFKGLRSSILVRGTIYGDNGAILQSQSAYCGNPLKDKSLKKQEFKDIRDAMNNELGENLVNLNIASGKGVPFTIVFNKAPKNIKEFTVEVLESKPGSK